MKSTIYVPDIECDSCVKIISRALDRQTGVDSYAIHKDSISLELTDITSAAIIGIINSKGFRASEEPFDRKSFSERVRHYKENKHKYLLERKVFTNAIYIFLILSVLEALFYMFLFNQSDFLTKYGLWLFFLNISIATIGMGIWHVLAYEAKFTCMLGMMIGMTVGMQTGMMIGGVIGITNGFFVGAMVGMLLGSAVGAYTGKCCGIMGVMEGMMAGLMGGTMGPMITVMMYSDHLLWFMPFYMFINIMIMWGLSYMMYEELIENNPVVKQKPIDFLTTAAFSVTVCLILIMVMIYGPKAPMMM